MWFLNETYTAQQAYEMGLVNKVVPAAELDEAVDAWTQTLGERSPTALALAKRSFNADSENIRGISLLALNTVKLFYETEESKEGVRAFSEKRKPDFHKYVK
jgi:2-ketocyclohexanecarboxyl-CoA hydrolase